MDKHRRLWGLVGARIGFNMVNTDMAEKVLAGDTVHPMFHAAIEREAVQLNDQIRTKSDAENAIARANKIGGE